jgi:ubiquinone/menaquinone biosynthesis C-methylase UbiE
MTENYVGNYIRAINHPLLPLQKTFDAELAFILKNSAEGYLIMEAGCGAGRPAYDISSHVKRVVCIDNDKKMLEFAKERCRGRKNIEIMLKDALHTGFLDNTFDLTYATYNLIGSLRKDERQKLVDEMSRITRKGGKIITITWKDDKKTTFFLRKYYPSIGIKIIESDAQKTMTSKGTFERIQKKGLAEYYQKAQLKNIRFDSIGPVWLAITGTK